MEARRAVGRPDDRALGALSGTVRRMAEAVLLTRSAPGALVVCLEDLLEEPADDFFGSGGDATFGAAVRRIGAHLRGCAPGRCPEAASGRWEALAKAPWSADEEEAIPGR